MNFDMDSGVKYVLDALNAHGFDAYIVGGWVRDNVMGRPPSDADIATNATPGRIAEVFSGCRLDMFGAKYGAIKVEYAGVKYDITTFRLEGDYGDFRRPNAVIFIDDIRRDLVRRDFTINAMAYAPHSGLIDMHGGLNDIENRKIRCAGDAHTRFSQDALRILRALKYAAKLEFHLDEDAAAAAFALKDRLNAISGERAWGELSEILRGSGAKEVIFRYKDIINIAIARLDERLYAKYRSFL